jgi:hypothetical protein
MDESKSLTVEDRERAIFKYLKELPQPEDGAPVKEIYERVSAHLDDRVTLQAYYKVVDRLTAGGKLDAVTDGAPEGRRYRLAPYLHADNAITLDDVYELLDELEPTDAIARIVDAREYFEERRGTTLKRAAEALLEEDPRDLVFRLVTQRAEQLQADIEILREKELADREIKARVEGELREFQLLVYRYLGLSKAAVDASRQDELLAGKEQVVVNEEALREELQHRVFGERCIVEVDAASEAGSTEWDRVSVSGSDSSTHASVMRLSTAPTYSDDMGAEVVTFNNSVVYVHVAPLMRDRVEFPYYSVPMSRSAIDDRQNRGMVLAPFMFRYLSESEYEHMAKCATDVVQWRADEVVFLGMGRSLADGSLLPRPTVHFRDGTITPQEREYGHYKRANEYGDMVREGIGRGRKILEKIIATDETPPVFGGAVKATQARFFSILLNWYIVRGSLARFGTPLDHEWDSTRAAHIADNEAMSFLLSTLEDRREQGKYFVSFAVMRPFHTLTEFFKTPKTPDYDWTADFQERLDRELKAYRDGSEDDAPYLASQPDVADDDFVYMCRKADYVIFYIGHTAGDPPPIAPRYEFLESLRPVRDAEKESARVERNKRLIVTALHRTKFATDTEHNFMSRKMLVKIIPYVVYEAHEKGKALGRKLEAELKSIVLMNLQTLRRVRSGDFKPSDVEFAPQSIRRFVERYARFLKDDQKKEPGRYER